MIYLGGWEAALAVCEGDNPLNISVLVETRDGPSEFMDAYGRAHTMMPPAGVTHIKVPATRLSQHVLASVIRECYSPLFRLLSGPCRMLVHCKNGRHRSAQVCSAVLFGIVGGNAQDVLNHLILRRSVVQFHALQGPRSRASLCIGLVHFRDHEPHSELGWCMFVDTSLTMIWFLAFWWPRVYCELVWCMFGATSLTAN
jgi:hypothetical protein